MNGLLRMLLCGVLLGVMSPAQAACGDPPRCEQLHRDCLGCHGTELYQPPLAKIKTLAALKKEVVRWNDRMNPKFTEKEVGDMVDWLNKAFYKFTP